MQDINSIRNAFKSQERNTGSGNYFNFFLMDNDQQARVRFLPDVNEENPMGFLVEKVNHHLIINGEKKTVPCLSMYGEDCPICAVSQQFYKTEGDKSVNGKKYWRKKSHVCQVLVVEDPLPADKETKETNEGKVKYMTIGFQLFNIIKAAFESGDFDVVPFAFEGGADFIIKKTPQGEWSTYALGSGFVRKSSSLDAETVAMCKEHMVDLSTLLPQHPGTEKIEAMLEAALSGTAYEEESSSGSLASAVSRIAQAKDTTEEDKPAFVPDETKPEVVVETKVEPQATATVSTPAVEDEDDTDDILAKIKRRRQQKNS